MLNIHVTSETQQLRSVIIGYPDNFLLVEPEIINETQKKYYFGAERPLRQNVIRELNGLRHTLQVHGIEVLQPDPVPGIPDQLMTRDIGVVVGDTFVVTRMARQSRRDEWLGINKYLERIRTRRIIKVPDEMVLEGGDVIVDKGHIFVGIGQRSTGAAHRYLAEKFPHFNVVPVQLRAISDGEDVLHLDCAFVPVGDHHALIYANGMTQIPDEIRTNYELIEVTQSEQQRLATNVLSIAPDAVISRPQSGRVNRMMRGCGLRVIELPFNEPPKTGGSFRCCSLPLLRQ
jgi:N-dimethylarginine dimethylaminohydrolase